MNRGSEGEIIGVREGFHGCIGLLWEVGERRRGRSSLFQGIGDHSWIDGWMVLDPDLD